MWAVESAEPVCHPASVGVERLALPPVVQTGRRCAHHLAGLADLLHTQTVPVSAGGCRDSAER